MGVHIEFSLHCITRQRLDGWPVRCILALSREQRKRCPWCEPEVGAVSRRHFSGERALKALIHAAVPLNLSKATTRRKPPDVW